MSLLDFFRRPPPRKTIVSFDGEAVTCQRSGGLVETVKWSDLNSVLIHTTHDGPAVDDVFWVLAGKESGCVVPSEAEGMDQLLERLQKLPGFDNAVVIQAMASAEDQEFICWERQAGT